ncbi:MAG: exported protein of unknown function [Candidatus Saccharibacteria bacterium]|nr:exported protein of unknown function [Candidatus Saccharibacteria bacterium]
MSKPTQQRIGAFVAAISVVGAILSPALVSATSNSANTTISASVQAVISIATSSTVSISLTPTGAGSLSNGSDAITVSTNDALGYNLTVADSDATTTLANGGSNFTASSGTKTTPITLANNTWGVAVPTGTTGIGTNGFDASYASETNLASSTSKWAGMPATGSPMLLKSTTSTATGDSTTVWYAVKADTTLPAGTYTDTVTYTATAN